MKTLTNRQYEHNKVQGKKAYRMRKLEEQDSKTQVDTYLRCSCLDSAFERQAINQGLCTSPVFPENKQYLKKKNDNTTI